MWIVRAGDGRVVGDVLRRAGEGPRAIDEGRVFIGRRRARRSDEPVRVGDAIRIGPRGDAGPKVEILLEERGLVACVKPAGLPSVPDHAGASRSLVALVAEAVGAKSSDLRVTSRLDREVSGVVVFALDDAAERRLRDARAAGAYERRYVALAAGALAEGGEWSAPIGRASDPRLRAVGGPEEKEATTRWRRVASVGGFGLRLGERGDGARGAAARPGDAGGTIALVAVDPLTGRTHQIRVHASHAGAPLVGDRAYGGPSRITLSSGRILTLSRVALHAARVSVAGVVATAPVPEELTALWRSIGGAPEAWDEAIRCRTGHA